MKELLKHGLNVDSKNHHGLTPIQIALAENNVDMVNLLVMNGADVISANTYEFPSTALNEMLQKREVGHRILVSESALDEVVSMRLDEEKEFHRGRCIEEDCLRVSIYKGHPMMRRETCCLEAGKLIRLPNSLEELKNVAGMIFSIHNLLHHLICYR